MKVSVARSLLIGQNTCCGIPKKQARLKTPWTTGDANRGAIKDGEPGNPWENRCCPGVTLLSTKGRERQKDLLRRPIHV